MKFYISNINTWCSNTIEQLSHEQEITWPKLDFVPAMQRRRLSPFAKIALYVANKTVEQNCRSTIHHTLPIIFSSRHGDLHRTSILLDNLANKEMLSPTAFGLSVHNAVPSLYSILTNNKAAINAIAAGKDSFFMGLVDAYARLKTGICDELLFIHADQNLPSSYDVFQDEQQISHAVAMKISLKASPDSQGISCSYSQKNPTLADTDVNCLPLPAALSFSRWNDAQTDELSYQSDNYHWYCKKV